MLEILTFTGIDADTDLDEVQRIQEQYPLVEFGVLVGSQTVDGMSQIFPPWEVVCDFAKLGTRSAVHLCGRFARATMDVDSHEGLLGLLCEDVNWDWNRIQVNLHGDIDNPHPITVDPDAFDRFLESAKHEVESVILQFRGTDWSWIPVTDPGVEYLFDVSEGAGKESFHLWPDPPATANNFRFGYCGGLGPHNIDKAMAFVNKHPDARLWLDMESKVRDSRYRLDLRKVRSVCEKVFDA